MAFPRRGLSQLHPAGTLVLTTTFWPLMLSEGYGVMAQE